MGAVTEFAFIPLRPGTDIEDENISEGQIMAQMLAKGKIAPGVQANYWGKQIDCSHFVHLLLDWDSLDAHKSYMARPDYGAFLAAAQSMVDPEKQAGLFHVPFQPHPPSGPLLSPLCEVIQIYFPEDLTTDSQKEFTTSFGKFIEKLSGAQVKGFTGNVSSGWALETVLKEGEAKKVFVGLFGWNGPESASGFKSSGAYEEIAGAVLSYLSAAEVAYVIFKSP
ncbi:hypothetical protein FB567DRAFT_512789 [Paraphoma chrysanthemicola]|uniref:ABM domain-containing protein n=1 Tax=Paraphoma chrysanthemicola TaxID=798071 RepID=A0A8K0RIC3_9PLEO|nr:hypothetical protein FB567DRAFT_512789 [Paraphoma chrysanthemicola]